MPNSPFDFFPQHRQALPVIKPMYSTPDLNQSLAGLMRSQAALMRAVAPRGGGRGGGRAAGSHEGNPRYGSYMDLPKGDGTTERVWVEAYGVKAQKEARDKALKTRQEQILAKETNLQSELAKLPTLSVEGQKSTIDKIRKEIMPGLTQKTGMTAEELSERILKNPEAELHKREKLVNQGFKGRNLLDGTRMLFGSIADAINSIGKTPEEKRAIGDARNIENQKIIQANPYLEEQQRLASEGRSSLGLMLDNPLTAASAVVPQVAPYIAPPLIGSAFGPVGLGAGLATAAGLAGAASSGEALSRVAADPNLSEADKLRVIDDTQTKMGLTSGALALLPGPISGARSLANIGKAALARPMPGIMRSTLEHTADAAVQGGAFQLGSNAAYRWGSGTDAPLTEGLGEAIIAGAMLGAPFGAKAGWSNNRVRRQAIARQPNPQISADVLRQRQLESGPIVADSTEPYRVSRAAPTTDTVLEPPVYQTFTDNTTNPLVESFRSTPGNVYVRPSQPNSWVSPSVYSTAVRVAALSRPEVTQFTPPVTAQHPQNSWTPNRNMWHTQQPTSLHVQTASLEPPPDVASIFISRPAQGQTSNPRNIWTPSPNVHVIQNPISPSVQVAALTQPVKTATPTSRPQTPVFSIKGVNTKVGVKQRVKDYLADGPEETAAQRVAAVEQRMSELKNPQNNYRYQAMKEALNEYRATTPESSGGESTPALGRTGQLGEGKPVAENLSPDSTRPVITAPVAEPVANANAGPLVGGGKQVEKRGYAGTAAPNPREAEKTPPVTPEQKPGGADTSDGKSSPEPTAPVSPKSDTGDGSTEFEGGPGKGGVGDEAKVSAEIDKIQNPELKAAAAEAAPRQEAKKAAAEQNGLVTDATTLASLTLGKPVTGAASNLVSVPDATISKINSLMRDKVQTDTKLFDKTFANYERELPDGSIIDMLSPGEPERLFREASIRAQYGEKLPRDVKAIYNWFKKEGVEDVIINKEAVAKQAEVLRARGDKNLKDVDVVLKTPEEAIRENNAKPVQESCNG